MPHKIFFITGLLLIISRYVSGQDKPVRLGIAGLTHGHVVGILDRKDTGNIKIVGISETNRDLAERYSKQYGFPMSMVYHSID